VVFEAPPPEPTPVIDAEPLPTDPPLTPEPLPASASPVIEPESASTVETPVPPQPTPGPQVLELPRNAPRRSRKAEPAARPKRERQAARSAPATRREREVAAEPSVIVDIQALTRDGAVAARAEAPVPEDDAIEEAAAPVFPDPFDLAVVAPAPAEAAPDLDSSFESPELDELETIRPPGLGRLVLYLVLAAVAGFVVFVLWRNHWRVEGGPPQMIEVAFGQRAPAPPTFAAPVEIAQPEAGQPEIRDLHLERVPRHPRAVAVTGELVNTTNTTQSAVQIEASVVKGGLPRRSRVVACCEDLDREAVLKIVDDPDNPHFAERFSDLEKVRVAPGESRRFTVVFRDLDADLLEGALEPKAQVRSAEAVRTP
jgi:hypothetical protein